MLTRATIFRKKHKFCKKHRLDLEKVKNLRRTCVYQDWWKTKTVIRIVRSARKDIGYSPKTVDMDIMNSLVTYYKKHYYVLNSYG